MSAIVVARRADRLDGLAERYESITALAADLNDDDDLTKVASVIADRQIDLVVNNAGFGTAFIIRVEPCDVSHLMRVRQDTFCLEGSL